MTGRLHLLARGGAGLAAIVLLVGGLWVGLWALIVGGVAVVPDPGVLDGDPCCGWPDTWAQQRLWMVQAWVWVVPSLIVLVGAGAMARAAITGRRLRWPRPRTVASTVGVVLALQWGWYLVLRLTH